MTLRPIVPVALLLLHGLAFRSAWAEAPRNLFANPGFELGGSGPWRMDKGGTTVAQFSVDAKDAAEGQRSALVAIESIDEWGTQFGQTFEGGKRGTTYTFAVLAKAIGAPVAVDLQIERSAKPWDRALRSGQFTVTKDKWVELHATFKVEKDFPEGWFAYVSCTQPKCRYRADLFRLYEGEYVPYEQMAKEEAAVAAVRLFDTGRPSAEPLTTEVLAKKAGWTAVAEDDVGHTFRGDAVLVNDKLALALRQQGRGAELCGSGPQGMKLRAVLAPAGGAAKLASVKIASNDAGAVAVDAAFETAGGEAATTRFELAMGQPFVATEPRAVATGLRVEAPCRFAVLPDFFADDIVADATALPVAQADLPSEHFLLHLLDGGEAVVMSVWNVAEQDVRVALSGEGNQRAIASSEIPYGKKGKVWVAVLEGPSVWHARNVAKDEAGRTVRLDWQVPYPALWRVDWTRSDKLTGSWEMLLQRPDGRFDKHTWLGTTDTLPGNRKRWTTVLGSFLYPCWIDRDGRGWLQPLPKAVRFEGPALVYPINRVRDTPLDRFTVVDIVRGTLGVGPCEYILDVENQHSRSKGRATCATRDALGAIYGKGQQRDRKEEIEKILAEVMVFIRYIRERIDGYVAFGHDLLDYLAEQKRLHPELAEPIGELETLTRAIDDYVAARQQQIKTPDHAAAMVEEFRATLLDYDRPDALEKVKKFTHAWVEIGGNQDELAGECRMGVKWVRQRAGLLMAVDPRMAEIAKEIRSCTQKILRNPAGHEGARH